MVTLTNPHTETVSVVYLGNSYSIKPGESLVVSQDLADFWLRTHEFLTSGSVEPTQAVVAPEPVVETPVDEPAPEVPVEEPASTPNEL